jgi:hypothetical protein
MNSFGDDLLDYSSLPPLMDPPFSNTIRPSPPYFSMRDQNHHQPLKQQDHKIFQLPTNNYTPITTNYQASNPSLYPQTPSFSFQANLNPGYLHQGYGFGIAEQGVLRAAATNSGTSGLERPCKVEQFSSNQSMVSRSQDTGVSTDMNAEISSVVSKQDVGSNRPYDDLDQGPSIGPIPDLDCLWDY